MAKPDPSQGDGNATDAHIIDMGQVSNLIAEVIFPLSQNCRQLCEGRNKLVNNIERMTNDIKEIKEMIKTLTAHVQNLVG